MMVDDLLEFLGDASKHHIFGHILMMLEKLILDYIIFHRFLMMSMFMFLSMLLL